MKIRLGNLATVEQLEAMGLQFASLERCDYPHRLPTDLTRHECPKAKGKIINVIAPRSKYHSGLVTLRWTEHRDNDVSLPEIKWTAEFNWDFKEEESA